MPLSKNKGWPEQERETGARLQTVLLIEFSFLTDTINRRLLKQKGLSMGFVAFSTNHN